MHRLAIHTGTYVYACVCMLPLKTMLLLLAFIVHVTFKLIEQPLVTYVNSDFHALWLYNL